MKNKEYKILSLLICAVVLLMLSGCNSSEGNKASTEGTATAFVTEGKEEVDFSSLEETANSATETQAVAETETTAETEAEPTTSNQEKESVDNGNGIVLPDDNW